MRKDENRHSSPSEEKWNVKRLLRKRWVVPAIYLIAAAGVLSTIFFIQGNNESAQPENNVEVTDPALNDTSEDAIEVATQSEVVRLPFEDENDMTVVSGFYDVDASEEEQQDALVYYNHSYYPNKGIDYAHVDGESFDVVAALSGTVITAEKDPDLGYVVEINHGDDFVTHYHSLENINVEVGSTVSQGDVIGRAGRNLYNQEAGVHVHFEIRHNGVALNPNDVFHQPLSAILSDLEEKAKEAEDKKEESDKQADEQDGEDEKADDANEDEKADVADEDEKNEQDDKKDE